MRVVVRDVGTDAALVPTPVPVLVIRAEQTFESAVSAVSALLPDMEPSEVRGLVRRHLPDAVRLDELIPAPTVNVAAPTLVTAWLPAALWAVLVGVLVAVTVGFVAIHQHL